MKTAVELLANELKKNHGIDLRLYDEFEKAKELEKEQIIDAWQNGAEIYDGAEIYAESAEQYYNETFKSDEQE
jgi:hypothetical protein